MSYQAYDRWKREPLAGPPHLSIIIPTYNEAERIVPTIGAMASHVSGLGIPWELIIADDGSTDDTVAIVQQLELINARVLIAEQNGGKGRAVQRGILAAEGAHVLFADADNSTPIEEIDKMLNKITNEGYDLAIGSRAVEGAEVANKSAFRQLMSNGLNWIVRMTIGLPIRDTQCGFKLYRKEAAHRLHNAQTLMGFSFDLEMLYLAQKLGYRIAEVPVAWYDTVDTRVDSRREIQRFLRDLLRIKMTDWQGGYAHA